MTGFVCTDVQMYSSTQKYTGALEFVQSHKASVRPLSRGPGLSSLLYSTFCRNVQIDCIRHSDLKMRVLGGHTLELSKCTMNREKNKCISKISVTSEWYDYE